jgi:hypothetical protein
MGVPLVVKLVGGRATKNPPAAGLKQSITISDKIIVHPLPGQTDQSIAGLRPGQASQLDKSAKKERALAPEWPETDARCAVNWLMPAGRKSRTGVSDAGNRVSER